MSASADEVPTMTHEEISRLGGLKAAEKIGARKRKQRSEKASEAARLAFARCKHPKARIFKRDNGLNYCGFCGRKVPAVG